MRNIVGIRGELEAKKYLIKQAYEILETNYSTKFGEIDIIARDKDCIVFVEVKSRSSTQFGLPCEAVSRHKIEKISIVALLFLQKNPKMQTLQKRFDVIEYYNNSNKINHIKNAFDHIV